MYNTGYRTYRYLTYSPNNIICKSRTYITVFDTCRFTVDVAVRPFCLNNSLEGKLNHDSCQPCFYKSRSAAEEAANIQDSWSALSKDT